MKYPENIKELSTLPIDFMGMIFYEKSPRFVGDLDISQLDNSLKRVGVFVNEDLDKVISISKDSNLSCIQLHGNESPKYCKSLAKERPELFIIKAFNVSEANDFEKTKGYETVCNFFLFDTKTPQHGGSGKKFDWKILDAYKGNVPFFLSGGIGAEDAEQIKNITHPKLYALDLNSKFETEAGRKDIDLLEGFLKELKQ